MPLNSLPLAEISGTALAVCGIWVLQIAWRLVARSWPHLIIGWGLILVSLVLWGLSTASDKGVALGIVVWILVAICFLILAAAKEPIRTKKLKHKTGQRNQKLDVYVILNRTVSGLLIGPFAGLVAMVLATAAFIALQSAHAEITLNLTIVFLGFPIIWAVLSYLLGYQKNVWLRATTLIGCGLFSLSYIWMTT